MIFEEQISRKPDRYPFAQDFIRAMWHNPWNPDKFNFNSDVQDFKTSFSAEEQEIIKKTLTAIGQIEIAVKKFWSKLGDNLPHPSLSNLGHTMSAIEVIHNVAYEKLIKVLGLEDVYEENLKIDVIQGRVAYLKKHLNKAYKDSKKQYIYSLILFTLYVENVSLFSQFYIVLWFNKFKNVLKDTAQQVQYTKNEEMVHAQVGIKLIQTIRIEHPELFDEELMTRIEMETIEAYNAEAKIVDWMIGDFSHEHLDAKILKEYIKKRLNDSLIQLGMRPIFALNNELIEKTMWMEEEVLAPAMTDFFFKDPVDYSKNNKAFDTEELF